MKRSMKQLSLATFALLFIGAGASGVALADSGKDAKQAPLMPPQLHRVVKDISLSDAQKAKLADIREKQKALKNEFWSVFTEEQKIAMLEAMSKPHRGNFKGGKPGDRDDHPKRGDRDNDDMPAPR